MALIQRPVKQYGARTYLADFNAAPANPTPPPTNVYRIQPTEVDGDLDTIYALINGGLQNDNIAGNAAIAYSKLDLAGMIVNADISPTADIDGSKLADTSVPTAKLAVMAATPNKESASLTANQSGLTGPVDICTLPALTTRGGSVLIGGTGGLVAVMLGNTQGVLQMIVYRDATPIFTVDYKLLADAAAQMPVPCPSLIDQPAAGSYVYKLNIALSAGGTMATSANPGTMYAMEFA